MITIDVETAIRFAMPIGRKSPSQQVWTLMDTRKTARKPCFDPCRSMLATQGAEHDVLSLGHPISDPSLFTCLLPAAHRSLGTEIHTLFLEGSKGDTHKGDYEWIVHEFQGRNGKSKVILGRFQDMFFKPL